MPSQKFTNLERNEQWNYDGARIWRRMAARIIGHFGSSGAPLKQKSLSLAADLRG